jgi:glycosyltransferase involved in cell wall biosynthesis
VGVVAPPWIPVPPPAYGGTEAVIADLARGLVERGHDVRLFTVGSSTCAATYGHFFREPAVPLGDSVAEAAHVLAAYEALADVDVIHDHTVLGPLLGPRGRRHRTPLVSTVHGPFTRLTRPIFAEVARRAAVVAISRDHASRAGIVPVAATIHHGIDLDDYGPGPGGGQDLVFVGRMSPDKGVHRAVRIARGAGRRLRIIAKMREPEERAYFESAVRPLLDHRDEWPQELPLPARRAAIGSALGLLNPITWPEPFGLVMAESLALGTPVIAFPAGAAPEIVDDGLTGFLVPDEQAAARAVDRLGEIDRRTCRAVAEERFGLARMARDYEALYVAAASGGLVPAPGTALLGPSLLGPSLPGPGLRGHPGLRGPGLRARPV